MENQRVRLSKAMLKNALIELLRTKSIDKISVYELCKTAGINRTTFYKYYSTQTDLLNDIVDDFFEKMQEILPASCRTESESLVKLLEYIYSESEKWRLIINVVTDEDFTEKLFNIPIVDVLVKERIIVKYSEKQKEYLRVFWCQGGYAIIRKWLNDGTKETPREIAELITMLVETIVS